MEEKIYNGEGFMEFECNCGEELGQDEDNMMDACSEPFNGSIITCPKCGKEYDIQILFRVNEI